MPTTVHKSPPNLICRPIWAPKKQFVMPAPTIVSRAPHLNILPAMIRTCGLSCNAASSMPRTVTLLIPSDPIFRRFIITTTSLGADELSLGGPGDLRQVSDNPGRFSIDEAHDLACRRLAHHGDLSSEPVDFKVCWTPLAIIKTAVKTNTTRAMLRIVTPVVRRRDDELRRIYFNGICI